jgi:N6-L-threonylcarbamoyladenine synthase
MFKTILAIESSCDETAASVIKLGENTELFEYKILSSVIDSQISLHSQYGGVFPEMAARVHVQKIKPVVVAAVEQAGVKIEGVDAIAVTSGPGLIASLIVGVEFAKGLSMSSNKPLIQINHMEGHLYSFWKSAEKPLFPILSLVVSGGHTLLVLVSDFDKYRVIGSTLDDAAGEAFDKTARMLDLPYPGGPALSKLASLSKGDAHEFPRPLLNSKDFNFSFSGLKTSVLYYVQKQTHLGEDLKADIACGIENAIVDVLVKKTMKAAKEFGAKTITLSGGVAANKKLQIELSNTTEKEGMAFLKAQPELCTDNAAMIGLCAGLKTFYGTIGISNLHEVKANASWEII